ncbi:MAG: Asp-tRNA(Asn)/Glu-tRNA(Gln) amidotransferase subunit GatC [Fluviicola sp.]
MNITDETVDHIAHLSRLRFEGAAKEEIKSDLEKIIGFMGKLSELDTEGIEPLVFMSDEINVLREDFAEVTVTKK